MYPLHPRNRPLNERQVRVVYDYYVEQLIPGLLAEGFDPGPVPAWEEFLRTYDSYREWDPYGSLRDATSMEEFDREKELPRRYPPMPPDEELYPELRDHPQRR